MLFPLYSPPNTHNTTNTTTMEPLQLSNQNLCGCPCFCTMQQHSQHYREIYLPLCLQTEVKSTALQRLPKALEASTMHWSISPFILPVASTSDPKHLNSQTTSTAPSFNCRGATSTGNYLTPSTSNLVLGTLNVNHHPAETSSKIFAATTYLEEQNKAASSANKHTDTVKDRGLLVCSPTNSILHLNSNC